MLEEIGTVDNIPAFIEQVKNKKRRLMGFGTGAVVGNLIT